MDTSVDILGTLITLEPFNRIIDPCQTLSAFSSRLRLISPPNGLAHFDLSFPNSSRQFLSKSSNRLSDPFKVSFCPGTPPDRLCRFFYQYRNRPSFSNPLFFGFSRYSFSFFIHNPPATPLMCPPPLSYLPYILFFKRFLMMTLFSPFFCDGPFRDRGPPSLILLSMFSSSPLELFLPLAFFLH